MFCQFVKLSQIKTEGFTLGMAVRERISKQQYVTLNIIGKYPTYFSFGCKEDFSCCFEFTNSAKLFLFNS